MAGTRTGSKSIIRFARKICRLRAVYGAGDLATVATPEFAEAVAVLEIACAAFEALDNAPGEIDNVAPLRPGEDGPPL